MTQSSGQDGIQLDAAFERREQLMFAHQPKLDPAMPSRARVCSVILTAVAPS